MGMVRRKLLIRVCHIVLQMHPGGRVFGTDANSCQGGCLGRSHQPMRRFWGTPSPFDYILAALWRFVKTSEPCRANSESLSR